MQVTETSTEGLKREYRVVVPAETIDTNVNSRLTELGRTTQIKGFRQGKVPMSILKTRFGPSVLGEVLKQTLNSSAQQAIDDQGVRPALPPQIEVESFEQGSDLTFKVAVETLPEFEPADAASLELTRLSADVADETVDERVKLLAEGQRNFKPLEEARPAADGDQVVIDFIGQVDGEAFEGGTASDARLELGSGNFIPGFEEQLVGAGEGDKVTVTVTFPEAYPEKSLAGKLAEFEVEVKQVLEREAVTIDDALAARLGLDDLTALRDATREHVRREYATAARQLLKRQVLDKLADLHDFDVPVGMIDREFEQIWRQIEDDMKRGNLTWEESEQPEDDARAEYRGIAERRVRLGLVLSEIGRRNNITVPKEELNRAMMEQARRFPGQEQQVFDYFRNSPEALNELQAPIYEDKVIDFVVELAKVTEEKVAPERLFRDPDEANEASAANEASTANEASEAKEAKADEKPGSGDASSTD